MLTRRDLLRLAMSGAALVAADRLKIGRATAMTSDGMLGDVAGLPTAGTPWTNLSKVAKAAWPAPNIIDQDSKVDSMALAAALVSARTGDAALRDKARKACLAVTRTFTAGTSNGALSVGRQLGGWVAAAQYAELDDATFRSFVGKMLTDKLGTHSRWYSLVGCHEDSDNNWGACCGYSRLAAEIFLGRDISRTITVHKGFLGNRAAYANFKGQGSKNSALSPAARAWSCNAAKDAYTPTNGDCGDKSGAFPSDASRNGAYPTIHKTYTAETTTSVALTATLAYYAGHPEIWADAAMRRIGDFSTRKGCWNVGPVQYVAPWMFNRFLGTSYPVKPNSVALTSLGRGVTGTDWLYG